jgi:hypothetical protein
MSVSPCLHVCTCIDSTFVFHLCMYVDVCLFLHHVLMCGCPHPCVRVDTSIFVHGWCMCLHLCMCIDRRSFLCVCMCVDAHICGTFPGEAKRLWCAKLIQRPYVYLSFFMCLCLNVLWSVFSINAYQCILDVCMDVDMLVHICVLRMNVCIYYKIKICIWHASTSMNGASKVHCWVSLIKMLYCLCNWTHRAMCNQIQLIRIEARVPEYGWTTQKVFHLMNFVVNAGMLIFGWTLLIGKRLWNTADCSFLFQMA